MTNKNHKRQTQTCFHVPVRIILKANLLGRTLPIPNFPTRSINHLVMIILLPHTFRDHGTSLEVDSLPGTYLTVNVCQAQREECCLGCRLASAVGAVDAAEAHSTGVVPLGGRRSSSGGRRSCSDACRGRSK